MNTITYLLICAVVVGVSLVISPSSESVAAAVLFLIAFTAFLLNKRMSRG